MVVIRFVLFGFFTPAVIVVVVVVVVFGGGSRLSRLGLYLVHVLRDASEPFRDSIGFDND